MRPIPRGRSLAGILVAAACVLLTQPAAAAPQGKAWAPIDVLQAPGFETLIAPRLELQPSGSPKLFVGAVSGSTAPDDALGYDWMRSGWTSAWRLNVDPIYLWPVDAPPGRYPLVFVGGSSSTSRNLYWSEVIDNQPSTPERIASTSRPYETNYSGAMRGLRRWAALQDNFENNGFLRLFVSDAPGMWDELQVTEPTSSGVSLVALDDSTALVAWASNQYETAIHWGLISGKALTTAKGVLTDVLPYAPRLRAHPKGGAWLTWGTNEATGAIRRFENGAWGSTERLHCNYSTNPFGVNINVAAMSHDTEDRPTVTWYYQSFLDGSHGVCVSIPNDSGWEVGEEVFRGSSDMLPTTIRDRNGDTWVAWSERFQPLRWTHTYTTATASSPSVSVETGFPRVSWVLSESAPGSWWAVLRQSANGPVEEVVRVQAESGVAMSWLDTGYRPGAVLRDGVTYRIRRESVDARYEALSPEGTWTPGRRLRLAVQQPLGGVGPLTLLVAGETGRRVKVAMYDVSGRLVQRTDVDLVDGKGSYLLPAASGLSAGPAGVYFLQARDESGNISEGVKIVRLRQ